MMNTEMNFIESNTDAMNYRMTWTIENDFTMKCDNDAFDLKARMTRDKDENAM